MTFPLLDNWIDRIRRGGPATTPCPFCCGRISWHDSCYIAGSPSLYGDEILLIRRDIRRRYFQHQLTRASDGRLLDKAGVEPSGRACPQCRREFPPALLNARRRPIFLSLVGAPRTGRTTYLAALVHALRRDARLAVAIETLDTCLELSEFAEALTRSYDPALPPASAQLRPALGPQDQPAFAGPRPAVLYLSSAESKQTEIVVVYDNPGEHYCRSVATDPAPLSLEHLRVADGILFAIDPLAHRELTVKLEMDGVRDPQIDRLTTPDRLPSSAPGAKSGPTPVTVLDTLWQTASNKRPRGRRGVARLPIAVLLNKSDVWLDHIRRQVQHTPDRPEGVNGALLRAIGSHGITGNLHDWFGACRVFPVSSIGSSQLLPVDAPQAPLARLSFPVTSSPNVAASFLWLLAQCGSALARTAWSDGHFSETVVQP